MRKVLLVASVPSMIGQFNMSNIEILQEMGCKVAVACNFKDRTVWNEERIRNLKKELRKKEVSFYQIDFARNAIHVLRHFNAYSQLNQLVQREDYDLIHCHTPIVAMIARVVAHRNHVKVIYTAHGFHFYKGAPLKNWLLYYPVEKFLSRWTDCLITINKEDYGRAKRKFHAKRIEYVPGVGVDTKKFNSGLVDVEAKRKKLGISDDNIMLFSVGELNKNKNHSTVIQAVAKLGNPSVHYVIAGQGELRTELEDLAKELGIARQVHLLGFRDDVADIMRVADLYCLPSLREGLNVSLMEAIACKTPVICSRIRGNVELIQNEKSMFDPDNVNDLTDCLRRCIGKKDRKEFQKGQEKETIVNYKNILSCDIKNVCNDMRMLYCDIGGGRII